MYGNNIISGAFSPPETLSACTFFLLGCIACGRHLVHRLGRQQHGLQPERLQQPTYRRGFKLEFKPGRQSQSLTEGVLEEFARIFLGQSLIHDAVASTATIHFTT